MVAVVRALADRFIYDTATVKHIAANLNEEAAGRTTPGSGWTVRQLLAHLALNQQRYADTVHQWLDDPVGALPHPPGDLADRNAAMAAENVATPITRIVAEFDSSIGPLVAGLRSIDEARAAGSLGPRPLLDVLTAWAGHYRGHAVDLVSALPEFKTDPMVLNWVLHFDYSDRPEWSEWQLKLIAEVREIFQLQGAEA